MNDEYTTLLKNHTLSLTSLLVGAKVVGCKWLLKNKYHVDDSFQRHKAQLVAKGFIQTEGCDYGETHYKALHHSPGVITCCLCCMAHPSN